MGTLCSGTQGDRVGGYGAEVSTLSWMCAQAAARLPARLLARLLPWRCCQVGQPKLGNPCLSPHPLCQISTSSAWMARRCWWKTTLMTRTSGLTTQVRVCSRYPPPPPPHLLGRGNCGCKQEPSTRSSHPAVRAPSRCSPGHDCRGSQLAGARHRLGGAVLPGAAEAAAGCAGLSMAGPRCRVWAASATPVVRASPRMAAIPVIVPCPVLQYDFFTVFSLVAGPLISQCASLFIPRSFQLAVSGRLPFSHCFLLPL